MMLVSQIINDNSRFIHNTRWKQNMNKSIKKSNGNKTQRTCVLQRRLSSMSPSSNNYTFTIVFNHKNKGQCPYPETFLLSRNILINVVYRFVNQCANRFALRNRSSWLSCMTAFILGLQEWLASVFLLNHVACANFHNRRIWSLSFYDSSD